MSEWEDIMNQLSFLINEKDLMDLRKAKSLLEKKSVAIKIANLFGDAAETLGGLIPLSYRESIAKSNVAIIEKSWEFSVSTMSPPQAPPTPERRHILWVTLSGAIGGVGILTLFAELPVTTVLMLRAVADVARDEGEDYNQFETKIASLEVFALGGDAVDKQIGETGYYTIRNTLQQPLEESSKYIAKKGMAGMGAPFAVQLIAKIGAKYQTIVAAQTAARVIPVAGAIAGAFINVVFINLFQDKARGHFIVRRLEKRHGADTIRQAYNAIQLDELENMRSHVGHNIDEKNDEVSPNSTAERILRHHVWTAMGVGLIPVPIMDFAGVSLVQLMLLKKLAKVYGVPFSNDMAKNIASSLVGGALPFPAAAILTAGVEKLALTASLAKFIPGIGHTIGAATMPVLAGAATYALGKVFIQHFASGGTFLTFDPEKVKAHYAAMFQQGKRVAANMSNKKSDVMPLFSR